MWPSLFAPPAGGSHPPTDSMHLPRQCAGILTILAFATHVATTQAASAPVSVALPDLCSLAEFDFHAWDGKGHGARLAAVRPRRHSPASSQFL